MIILCIIFSSRPSATDVSLQINSILGKNFVTSYFSLSNSVKYVNSCRLIFPINVKPIMSLQETPASLRTKGPAWSINMFHVLTQNFYSNTKFMRASGFSSPAFTSFLSKWCFVFCRYPIFSTLFEVFYYPAIHWLADIQNPVINGQGQNFKNMKTLRSTMLWQRCSFVPTN